MGQHRLDGALGAHSMATVCQSFVLIQSGSTAQHARLDVQLCVGLISVSDATSDGYRGKAKRQEAEIGWRLVKVKKNNKAAW